jgi:N-acetylglucosaminyldiphosphoundecaprenol N-acetyl-beta-D-mannosaminyltransferase
VNLPRQRVVSLEVTPLALEAAVEQVITWAQAGESRSACAANVHMVMEAHDDPAYAEVVNGADLVLPDGMPLVWGLRLLGLRGAARACGPDLMLGVCRRAAREGLPVGFYGATDPVLAALAERLVAQCPGLSIAYAFAPPFRPLDDSEVETVREAIRASGVRMLFVGLGCPKQEQWMARERAHLPAVLLGVGAAIDFHAGTLPRAPRWMQRAGLEWTFRLAQEPRRLWKRYAKHNPRYLGLLGIQALRGH